MLNKPREPYYNTESEKEAAAVQYLPIMLNFAPEYLDFDFSDLISDYLKIKNDVPGEFDKMMDIQDIMEDILKNNGYADIGRSGNMLIRLTDKGRALKKAGSIAEQKRIDDEKNKPVANSIHVGGNFAGVLNQDSDFLSRDINQNANSTPPEKEKQQNAIVSFIVKWWWAFLLPLLTGILLLAIEKKWFK